MIREQPWHHRRASHWHHRWYRDLMDLQKLTLGWLQELDIDRPSHFLGPTVGAEARQAIQDLERAADLALQADSDDGARKVLESLLDDTAPEDLLGRIDHSVRTLQGWTLRSILEHCKSEDHTAWLGSLQQSSWKSGRESAQGRWGTTEGQTAFGDLRTVIDAFRESALGSGPGHEDILVIRATRAEAWIDFRGCPHRFPNSATLGAADGLCDLHAFWIRGYLYALNPSIVVDPWRSPDASLPTPSPTCALRWRIEG